ncbi:alpha/beta fold hydrolase [Flavobacterium sedimenticola]|uniref:Alpha/beta hydrolase n=1 Tax=Flavobacterium sedimenticola TaxID=3043286 RepID=A0ABT6XSV7_9FLAO|nr:alpha/beta hydrolase [Flavobacterium sedimenticola]MDI9257882.1 alpha/beta hydrolase [Flavobacterium sedimenticola]
MFSNDVKKWYDKGKFIHCDENKIFFHQDGEGDDVLIIHGYPFSSYQWKDFIDELSKYYKVTILDLPGFGFSDKPKKFDYCIEEFSLIINSVLAELNIKKTHLLCHDFGVNIGQELLSLNNQRKNVFKIDSVIFTNGPLFYQPHNSPGILKLGYYAPHFINRFVSFFTNKRKILSLQKLRYGPFTKPSDRFLEEQWETLKFRDGLSIIHKLDKLSYHKRKNNDEWIKAMNNNTIPLCYICGPFDRYSGRKMADEYLFYIKNPKVFLLDKYVGHYPHLENKESLIENILQFLSVQNNINEKAILQYQ